MSGGGQAERLDRRLVALGLADSRARAQALVRAGVVRVDGRPAAKAGALVAPGAAVSLTENPCPWVSRGALKLVAALDAFGIDPAGAEALDVGASTGGFTEVLLARGAARVTALDVGRGQLSAALRAAPQVVDLSPLNAKDLTAADLPAPPDLIVADVSFISLTKALAVPLALAAPGARLVALVKPQFEVGPDRVGKGGLVKDADARAAAVAAVSAWASAKGWPERGRIDSPILGGDGNREVLITAARAPDP